MERSQATRPARSVSAESWRFTLSPWPPGLGPRVREVTGGRDLLARCGNLCKRGVAVRRGLS